MNSSTRKPNKKELYKSNQSTYNISIHRRTAMAAKKKVNRTASWEKHHPVKNKRK